MRPVVQRKKTGCGIASVAAIAGLSYSEARSEARSLGIFADDPNLWPAPSHVRTLLRHFGFHPHPKELGFRSWAQLPDLALLSTKWHVENRKPFWHWVVFVRENGRTFVLDSKKALVRHIRTDFGRIKPRWYIPVRRR